ncbi:hypothetical protein CC86DRAFT_404881 [Ophiobolus disseminans]|uniref:Uncharacterized protein n=1 Tax=Ophiobolus disseminans TaxID=1469910 RepID=A0A6A7A526_9PLEO|nr:hypothetical protein CC86DRAFT_404881 [Ophiobolus disseminans]
MKVFVLAFVASAAAAPWAGNYDKPYPTGTGYGPASSSVVVHPPPKSSSLAPKLVGPSGPLPHPIIQSGVLASSSVHT